MHRDLGSFYIEAEDEYMFVDMKMINMFKGALLGMITEVQQDAPNTPMKERILFDNR